MLEFYNKLDLNWNKKNKSKIIRVFNLFLKHGYWLELCPSVTCKTCNYLSKYSNITHDNNCTNKSEIMIPRLYWLKSTKKQTIEFLDMIDERFELYLYFNIFCLYCNTKFDSVIEDSFKHTENCQNKIMIDDIKNMLFQKS